MSHADRVVVRAFDQNCLRRLGLKIARRVALVGRDGVGSRFDRCVCLTLRGSEAAPVTWGIPRPSSRARCVSQPREPTISHADSLTELDRRCPDPRQEVKGVRAAKEIPGELYVLRYRVENRTSPPADFTRPSLAAPCPAHRGKHGLAYHQSRTTSSR